MFDMCRSILSITERKVAVEIGGDREGGGEGLGKIWKRGVGNIGSLHKIGGLALLCQLFNYLKRLKTSPPPLKTPPPPPPHFWLPPFLVKIFHPLIGTIFEKSYPPLWRRRGRGFGLCWTFALKIKWLVSIWNATLGWNELKVIYIVKIDSIYS